MRTWRLGLAAVAGALVLGACGVGTDDGESPLDVLSPTVSAPAGDGESAQPLLAESPREGVASALDNPLAEGLPEPLVDTARVVSGGPPPDGIPPVDEPRFDAVPEVDWLEDQEPVLAVSIDGENRAYPVQILMWHEIVNDQVAGVPIAVTYCPLCNSALVFDRRLVGPDGSERLVSFGTSGQLFNSDLLMYDRQTESLWSQLIGLGVAGTLTGVELDRYPVQTVAFGDWREQNPEGWVLNRITGVERNYGANPYERYDQEDRAPFLFDGEIDERLPPKRRVVGVATPDGSQAVAVDHALLEQQGAVPIELDGRDLVAVMVAGATSALDSGDISAGRQVGATAVLDPVVDGQTLTLEVDGSTLRDAQTGTTWTLAGEAVEGPLEGAVLDGVPHSDPFWFAWAAFYPDTTLRTR
ncbi:MAG: DUF3179 domain-containing protein [Jiangellales bacterium]